MKTEISTRERGNKRMTENSWSSDQIKGAVTASKNCRRAHAIAESSCQTINRRLVCFVARKIYSGIFPWILWCHVLLVPRVFSTATSWYEHFASLHPSNDAFYHNWRPPLLFLGHRYRQAPYTIPFISILIYNTTTSREARFSLEKWRSKASPYEPGYAYTSVDCLGQWGQRSYDEFNSLMAAESAPKNRRLKSVLAVSWRASSECFTCQID